MRGIEEAAAQEHAETHTVGAAPDRHRRVTMPSTRHSVLAKAGRYRTEPERVEIVVDEPLLAIVHGLHADHTVRHSDQGLVCSCERFRRGEGVCAHVLAVEQHGSTSAEHAVLADLGEAPAAADSPRSCDVHAPSPANTDRLGTVSEEHR